MTGVLVAGSYNAGLTVYGPRLPRPGETVVGDGFDSGPGGKGANQAIGAQRLGADVTFVTKLGDDLFGRQARAVLAAEGLPEWGVLTGQAPTGVAFILVDAAAENMIAIAPGANLELTPADVLALEDRVRDVGIVLVQLECEASLAVGVAAWAREKGKRAILNPAPARELSISDLKAFEIITPNETELRTLADAAGTGGDGPAEQAVALVRAGVPNVVVTLGKDGALWAGADGVRTFPAPVVQAVDTTGAGDAFNAGLAAALARGDSLPDAIEYGCRAGAFCVTRRGVIDGLAYRADLETQENG
ncbi:MAG TPA: ribokinase [Trebonia sp.]